MEMMNDGHSWIVDIDLAKFFDTVDHDKLMTIIGRTIKDGDVISVVRKFLVSGVMIDDEYEDTIVGTPQGGNREKNLNKLGLPRRAAHGISYAKGYARVCRSWNLHIAISKERLAKFGLVSMEDYYAERRVTC